MYEVYIYCNYIYTYIHRSKFLCDILRLKSWCSPVNLAGNALWLVCSLWRGQQCQGSQAWESERIVGFSRFLSCVSKAVHQVCVWWSSFDYVSCLIDIHRAILSAQLSKVLFWSLVFQERWCFFWMLPSSSFFLLPSFLSFSAVLDVPIQVYNCWEWGKKPTKGCRREISLPRVPRCTHDLAKGGYIRIM